MTRVYRVQDHKTTRDQSAFEKTLGFVLRRIQKLSEGGGGVKMFETLNSVIFNSLVYITTNTNAKLLFTPSHLPPLCIHHWLHMDSTDLKPAHGRTQSAQNSYNVHEIQSVDVWKCLFTRTYVSCNKSSHTGVLPNYHDAPIDRGIRILISVNGYTCRYILRTYSNSVSEHYTVFRITRCHLYSYLVHKSDCFRS